MRIYIFHGTEGYPGENWFPWLKQELEAVGHQVIVPQFPSPPVVAAQVVEWFQVLRDLDARFDEETVIIGHSLGGVFTLRVLETLTNPIKAAVFVGTPVGEQPILNYERDVAFSGFDFNWPVIKQSAEHFAVYQSDNDPYVGLPNGEMLANYLGVTLDLVAGAGHFNTKAGYTEFEALKQKVLALAV